MTRSPREGETPDTAALVERMRGGDRAAREALFWAYRHKAEQALHILLRSRGRLYRFQDDLAAEADYLLWARLPRFDPARNDGLDVFCYQQVFLGLKDYILSHVYEGMRDSVRRRKSGESRCRKLEQSAYEDLLKQTAASDGKFLDDLIDVAVTEREVFGVSLQAKPENRHVNSGNIVEYVRREVGKFRRTDR